MADADQAITQAGSPEPNSYHSRAEAARKIQNAWRTTKPRANDNYLTSDVRWEDAAVHAKLKVDRSAAEQGKNDPRSRWHRAAFDISRLEDQDQMLSSSGTHDATAVHKILETQHWLELIDGKHRYGSNLKYYHKRWQQEDTEENFFKWLDRGGGKDLSLPECSRDKLESERITYLSSEQRLNYLVEIDEQGKLRWARNHELVDTTAGRWKDAGSGAGIVPADPADSPEDLFKPQRRESFASAASSSSSSVSSDAMHYNGPPKGKNPVSRAVQRNLTIKGMTDRVLKKTLKKNTWIYVADRHCNLFIGIKDQGKFQHSSFLGGGLVTSAGLISVKDGVIHSLSPLSGHYRTSIDHYRKFLEILKQRGVDTHKVEQTKAELALWGIEHLAKAKKWPSQVASEGKKRISGIFHPSPQGDGKGEKGHKAETLEEELVDDLSSWKKEVLYGRKGLCEEAKSATSPHGKEGEKGMSQQQHEGNGQEESANADQGAKMGTLLGSQHEGGAQN